MQDPVKYASSEIAVRGRAIQRGLSFIYSFASDPDNFLKHGSDLLCCFQLIAATASDPKLKRDASRFGRERARQWRRDWSSLPRRADARKIVELMLGSDAAERLGFPDQQFKQQLANAVSRFSVGQCLNFDPINEPPPRDIPDQCDCGAYNKRGRKTCIECRRRLQISSRYKVWYEALTIVHGSEGYGINLGAQLKDLLKWLPRLRPYHGRENGANDDFFDCVYAVTHLVYSLNHYNAFRLSPRSLPDEFAFLKTNLKEAIAMDDGEMLGEFLDSLKAFGLTSRNPLIRAGMDYLLRHQNPDGSWGDVDAESYTRYHSTWTAIDGLRDFDWQPKRKFLKPVAAHGRSHRPRE